jgi:hypothetical protein
VTILFLGSCSLGSKKSIGQLDLASESSVTLMSYTDMSGKFSLKMSSTAKNNKYLFQKLIYEDDFTKMLEKSRLVNLIQLSGHDVLKFQPQVSQFSSWFEGVEYKSEIKLDYKLKKIMVNYSPKEKKYATVLKIPDGDKLCFFSMLADCVKIFSFNGKKNSKEDRFDSFWFYVLMDSYPFVSTVYNEIENKLVTQAKVLDEGIQDGERLVTVEIFDQVLSLKFDLKTFNLKSYYWISQGISGVVQ